MTYHLVARHVAVTLPALWVEMNLVTSQLVSAIANPTSKEESVIPAILVSLIFFSQTLMVALYATVFPQTQMHLGWCVTPSPLSVSVSLQPQG